MTTGLIICGALAHEVLDLVRRHGWDAEIVGVDAAVHLRPERIAPEVARRIERHVGRYERLVVLFGDCGSAGALDALLADHPAVERIAGPHCYEMYGGDDFHRLMAQEPGTFFLTDFMVRAWRGTILKGLGLDRYPQLREEYFAHYRRVLYLAQRPTPPLRARAAEIAHSLELPLEIRETGYGPFEQRLVALMTQEQQIHE